MALSCDYSIGYQISCLLRVDNLTTKDKSNVTCRILDDSTSEATRTAKLLAGTYKHRHTITLTKSKHIATYVQMPRCMVTNSNQQCILSASDIATHTCSCSLYL